jgi:hypothetical protein
LLPLPLLPPPMPAVLLPEPPFEVPAVPAVLLEPPLPFGSASEPEHAASAAPRAKKYAEPEKLRKIVEFVIGSSVSSSWG